MFGFNVLPQGNDEFLLEISSLKKLVKFTKKDTNFETTMLAKKAIDRLLIETVKEFTELDTMTYK